VTERDYGIDAYIEITTLEGEVTGELCSIQLKGSNTIEWKDEDGKKVAKFTGVGKATVNYWMGLPIPVFLIWTDLSTNKAYFTSVKPQVRSQYRKYRDETQKTMGFKFMPDLQLGTPDGQYLFLWLYFMEKHFSKFRDTVRGLLIHAHEYNDFLMSNQGRDEFMEVEQDRQLMLIHIYDSCKFLSEHFGLKWTLSDLKDIYDEDNKTFGTEDDYTLHEQYLEKISIELRKVYIGFLEKIKELVSQKQNDYWRATDLKLYNVCYNLNLEWIKRYL
jgi:hypothetical protein